MHLTFWLAFALALLLLVLAGIAHLVFWGSSYRVAQQQDELRFAETNDGWRIALGRRTPRGAARKLPVLLCHGLSVNRGNLDFGVDRYSLSLFLAQAGFDCFAIDLRGHGASRRARPEAPRRWNFDTYLAQDVPAVLDEIAKATGSAQVLWVGHSQGALLGLCAASLYPARIAAVAALAPPTHFAAQKEVRTLLRFAFLGMRRNRLLARAAAPIVARLHLALSQLAINTRNIDPRIIQQLMTNIIEDVSPGVFAQFIDWARTDRFTSADGKVDYRAGLARAQQPALFLAGARDRLAPAASVRAGFELWGGPKELYLAGLAEGLKADYGHSDLIFGQHAPEEIFPRVRDWLIGQSGYREGHLS